MILTGRAKHEPLKELLIFTGPGGFGVWSMGDGPDDICHMPYSDTAYHILINKVL